MKIEIYVTTVYRVASYGCDTGFLIVREAYRLGMFAKSLLSKTFGTKEDEVRGNCGKLHSEDLHLLYRSPNTIRVITEQRTVWAGHVERMGERGGAYRDLVG